MRASAASSPAPADESPFARALRIRRTMPGRRAEAFELRPSAVKSYLRVSVALLPEMVARLEATRAPTHIWFWVAWGPTLPSRLIRMALAIYLRHEVDPDRPGRALSSYGWLRIEQESSVERVFRESLAGKAVVAWATQTFEHACTAGAFLPTSFWGELELRVAAAIPDLDAFWRAVRQRMLLRPRRKHRGGRAVAIPDELAEALATIAKYTDLSAAARTTARGNDLASVESAGRRSAGVGRPK